MIVRLYIVLGIVLLGGTSWFIVGKQPPTVQAPPVVGEITRLQEAGVIPKGEIEENPAIEHGIFETPQEDEQHLEEAMANMGSMPGMNMGSMPGMKMDGDSTDMDMDGDSSGMKMDGGTTGMKMDGDSTGMTADGKSTGMKMGGDSTDMAMGGDSSGMKMDGDSTGMTADGKSTGMKMDGGTTGMTADGKSTGMKMDGDSTGMAMGGDSADMEMDDEEAAHAMAQKMAGLVITEDGPFDREIRLSMKEWTFSPLNIEVREGERIRFTLRNDGTLLHEFMFMTMPEMQAIGYRAKRADWSLYEHEALYEKALVLPGEEITFVATISKPGAWMFMCMLPYHMQMGMMGQMATPGAAMKM